MKKITLLISIIVISVLTACGGGGGGGGGSSSATAPGISNLQYSPNTATVGQGGGAVTVNGTVDFIDNEGDVSTLIINSSDGTSTTVQISGVDGITAGTIAVVAVVDTSIAGNFPFTVYIRDKTGLKSNELTGTFTVN